MSWKVLIIIVITINSGLPHVCLQIHPTCNPIYPCLPSGLTMVSTDLCIKLDHIMA